MSFKTEYDRFREYHGMAAEVQIIDGPEGSSFIPTALLVNGGLVAKNILDTLPPKMAARMRTPYDSANVHTKKHTKDPKVTPAAMLKPILRFNMHPQSQPAIAKVQSWYGNSGATAGSYTQAYRRNKKHKLAILERLDIKCSLIW